MKKLFLGMLLALTCAFSRAQINNTRLWEVSHPKLKHASYLLGTVHSGYEGLFNFNDSLFWALDQSSLVALELDNQDFSFSRMANARSASREMGYLMLECILELLPKYKEQPIDTLVHRYLKGMKTIYNTQEATEKSEQSRSMVFDDFISAYARFNHKEVEGIETITDQLKAIFSFDKRQLTDIVRNFFNNTSRFSTNLDDDSVVLYAANNQTVKICKAFQYYTTHPIWGSYYRRILDDRNIKMTQYVVEKSKEGVMTCAVGLGHMCGPQGIISLLEKKGYTVRPINISAGQSNHRLVTWTEYRNPLFTTVVPKGVDTIMEQTSYLGLTAFNGFQKKQRNVYVEPKGAVWFEYSVEHSYEAAEGMVESVEDHEMKDNFEESLSNYIEGNKPREKTYREERDELYKKALAEAIDEAEEDTDDPSNTDALDEEEVPKKKKKQYPSRFVEFWSKVNQNKFSDDGGLYENLDFEENEPKKDTISLGAGLGNYTVTYSDDVTFEYVLPGNRDVTLRIRGDEEVMKREELLEYFRKAKRTSKN